MTFIRQPFSFSIGRRNVGKDQPCYVIAEIGVNHNGDPQIARDLIDACADAKVDAVKFQTFKAEKLVSSSAPKADYQKRTTGEGESQLDMLRRLELSQIDLVNLQAYCAVRGLTFLSTPFDHESVELLHRMGAPAYKTSSGDLTNLPLLRAMASKGTPMLVSTGMATLAEVDGAVRAVREVGCEHLCLLQCVSNYPADPANTNLMAMDTMSRAFGVPVGYSDHTMGHEVTLAAVALGACVVEKHVTLDKGMPGPDHAASIEPDELVQMVRAIRSVESALGTGEKNPSPSEANTASVARRSICAATDLGAGHTLAETDLEIKRPGTGLPSAMLEFVIGRKLKRDIKGGDVLTLSEIE